MFASFQWDFMLFLLAAYKYSKEWQVKQIVFILNSPQYSYENGRFVIIEV